MVKDLHIDYITFQESNHVVAFAPQLELCFDASTKEKSLEYLEEGTKALLDFWKDKNVLDDKIIALGLNGTTTAEQREEIQRNIKIPYFLLKKEKVEGTIDIKVSY